MNVYSLRNLARFIRLCRLIKLTFLVLAFAFLTLEFSFFAFFQSASVQQPKLENNIQISSAYEEESYALPSPIEAIRNNQRRASSSSGDDYSRLFDISDFRFLINNENICRHDGDQLFMTIFVHSSLGNFQKRNTIRRTWGNASGVLKFFNNTHNKVRLVFLVGITRDHNPRLAKAVHAENEQHHDLVQGNFIDSYRNMTYKHVMGLKWVTHHCSNAQYIFKADDDFFVDLYQLVYFLKGTAGERPRGYMACNDLNHKSLALRSYRNKWRVSFKEYSRKYYPHYCSGWSVLMSIDVVLDLYRLALGKAYFWIDDVFVSGMLARELNITHIDLSAHFDISEERLQGWLHSADLTVPPVFSLPDIPTKEILQLWNKTALYYRNTFDYHF